MSLAYELLQRLWNQKRAQKCIIQSDDFLQAVLAPGGILASERCIAAHIDLAKQSGAHVRLGERVLTWHANEDSVLVTTDKRRYSAKKLILAAGAWMPQLVPELQVISQNC